jgi:hypothetical protein
MEKSIKIWTKLVRDRRTDLFGNIHDPRGAIVLIWSGTESGYDYLELLFGACVLSESGVVCLSLHSIYLARYRSAAD